MFKVKDFANKIIIKEGITLHNLTLGELMDGAYTIRDLVSWIGQLPPSEKYTFKVSTIEMQGFLETFSNQRIPSFGSWQHKSIYKKNGIRVITFQNEVGQTFEIQTKQIKIHY